MEKLELWENTKKTKKIKQKKMSKNKTKQNRECFGLLRKSS